MASTVVERAGVEISGQVGFTFRGQGVISSFLVHNFNKANIPQSLETTLESNHVHVRRLLSEIVVNDRGGLCNADFGEVLKDGFIFFVHPMSPPSAHHRSVFQFGRVEISGEVGTPFGGDLVVSTFDFIRESFIGKFVHAAGNVLPRFPDIVSDNGGREVEFLIQALKDALIGWHIHPPRRFSHDAQVLAMSYDAVDSANLYHVTSARISLNDDNTYRVRVTYLVITTAGMVRDRVKGLRAGDATPNPVVDQTTMKTNDPRALKRPQDETDDGSPTTHFDAICTLAGDYDRVRLGGRR